jgi:hypothetical protein
MTALHCAAERNHVEVASLLLNKGADVNAKTMTYSYRYFEPPTEVRAKVQIFIHTD